MSNIVSIVATGDSLTFTAISYFYQASGIRATTATTARLYSEGSVPRADVRHVNGGVWANWAMSGWRIGDLETQAPSLDALINNDYSPVGGRPGRRYILVVRIGTNTTSNDPAVAAARVRTYCLARQAAGWSVVLCPIPSAFSPTLPNYDTVYAQPYNAIISGWGTSDGVAGVVSSADALMYGTGAHNDTTYFDVDKVHPNTAGHARLATDLNAVLAPLITSLAA